jgi:C4-type Zn-finger protein
MKGSNVVQIKDDIEKDIFLAEVEEETKKSKDENIREAIKNKANMLFVLVFDFSNKGLVADAKEIKRKLRSVIEEE